MKKIISGIMFMLLILGILIFAVEIKPVKSEPETWIVDDDGPANFHTIQEAVNAASPGDIIYVKAGTYYEHVVVNKTLSLIGENRNGTIIDGNSTGTVVKVTADNVSITGFTIQNSGYETVGFCDVTILWYEGICVYNSSGVNISRNFVVNNGYGIRLYYSNSNIITENDVSSNWIGIRVDFSIKNVLSANNISLNTKYGIRLTASSNNTIFSNIISQDETGISLVSHSNSNTLSSNIVSSNKFGLQLCNSAENVIHGNNILDNQYGIYLDSSSNNVFFHNNFNNTIHQVHDISWYNPPDVVPPSINIWNIGYPSGGNYWSDYNGTDLYSGPYQNETGSDGIGDTAYVIDENNKDVYPLMGMIYDFEVEWKGEKFHIEVISNATVSNLAVVIVLGHFPPYLPCGQVFIQFFTEDTVNATKFCRVTIPRAILNGTYIVLIDLKEAPTHEIPTGNSTHAYLYFTYQHSKQKHEVIIVPEFTLTTTLLVLMIFILSGTTTLWKIKKRNPAKYHCIPTMKTSQAECSP